MAELRLPGEPGFWEALQRMPEVNRYPQAARVMRFEGMCPFLFCLIKEPHGHPVCQECGAMRYGNSIYCSTCSEVRETDFNPTVP